MNKQAGIYARYSPGRDRDQTSTIEAQVTMCREKAQREGVAIAPNHIYVSGLRSYLTDFRLHLSHKSKS